MSLWIEEMICETIYLGFYCLAVTAEMSLGCSSWVNIPMKPPNRVHSRFFGKEQTEVIVLKSDLHFLIVDPISGAINVNKLDVSDMLIHLNFQWNKILFRYVHYFISSLCWNTTRKTLRTGNSSTSGIEEMFGFPIPFLHRQHFVTYRLISFKSGEKTENCLSSLTGSMGDRQQIFWRAASQCAQHLFFKQLFIRMWDAAEKRRKELEEEEDHRVDQDEVGGRYIGQIQLEYKWTGRRAWN